MKCTIESQIDGFVEYLADKDKSESTVRAYKTDVRLFHEWLDGMQIDAVKPRNVIAYKRILLKQRKSPATVNRKLISLLVYFEWSKEMGLTENNPAKNVDLIDIQPGCPKSMNCHDLDRIMDAVRRSNNIRDLAIFTLLLNTGIRVGEMCELKICDLDLESDTPRLTIWLAKGEKTRNVNLNNACVDVLKTHLNLRRSQDTEYLFDSQKSKNLTTRGVGHLFTSYCLKAGIKPVSPHIFRHTRAKSLIDAGFSIDRVAKVLGHASIETTKIYTSPTEADLLSMLNSVQL